ncbi:MAG: hypothetical protein ACREID_08165 [Planctomycetota bacterium]
MILDRTHRAWLLFAVAALAASAGAYALYARSEPGGPSGGSAPGLAFGIAGSALVLFAASLGLRKKVPHWRVGRAAAWLRGHLWLGALSFPLILFHAGFEFGGPLTTVLMWIFVAVFATGVLGALLQHFVPRVMMNSLPQETVYEQIDHVRDQLLAEAEQLAAGGGGKSGAVPRAKSAGAIQGRVVESRAAVEGGQGADRAPLERFLAEHVRPFCARDGARRSPLWHRHARAPLFAQLRLSLAPELHGAARDLEAICEQRAQLEVQRRMHHWLHGWLFVHVPLAYALVLLAAAHAVMALYY